MASFDAVEDRTSTQRTSHMHEGALGSAFSSQAVGTLLKKHSLKEATVKQPVIQMRIAEIPRRKSMQNFFQFELSAEDEICNCFVYLASWWGGLVWGAVLSPGIHMSHSQNIR